VELVTSGLSAANQLVCKLTPCQSLHQESLRSCESLPVLLIISSSSSSSSSSE
jgi:hypothetical protein